ARDPHDVLAELLGIRLGHCFILPGRLTASQVQMSPNPAAVPAVTQHGRKIMALARPYPHCWLVVFSKEELSFKHHPLILACLGTREPDRVTAPPPGR
ncbi:hypothetical protein, partial [Streptomyces sp. UH6]|uniref:hypothetical protein n=1 Tax=Streptomyces sp. UH6 TaxID=2748379 RepID=UPI001C555091